MDPAAAILATLPGKDCGQCGFKTCAALAVRAVDNPEIIQRCIYQEHLNEGGIPIVEVEEKTTWVDMLNREYDFVLEAFPEDPGPREEILPFNPGNVEKLGIKKGDVLVGRPAWVGCPVTHVGKVMEDPDYFNGTIVWCVVGLLEARKGNIEIGKYNPVAYEGIVRMSRTELQIGRRYFFLPRTCMMQSRHSGVVSALAKREHGLHARVEGIWVG